MPQRVLRNDIEVLLCWDKGRQHDLLVLGNAWRLADGFGRLFKHAR
jgi:hypothetical protein